MNTTPVTVPGPPLRHPLDPDPVRSSKAYAVFGLGLVAALTGLLVGGVVPATVGLALLRQARREAYASGGYLTGASWLRRGEWLAWTGLVLACVTAVLVAVLSMLDLAGTAPGQDFAPGFD